MKKQKRILIVEDDLILKEQWMELLEEEGYLVDSATDGKQGLQKAKRYYYDLIYTGILMPKINGIDFIKTIKEKKIKHGKIIVFSNLKTKDVIDAAIEAGADKYIILSETTVKQGLHLMKKLLT